MKSHALFLRNDVAGGMFSFALSLTAPPLAMVLHKTLPLFFYVRSDYMMIDSQIVADSDPW